MFHSACPLTSTPKSYQPVKSKYSSKLHAWFTKVTLKGSLDSGSKHIYKQNIFVTGGFGKCTPWTSTPWYRHSSEIMKSLWVTLSSSLLCLRSHHEPLCQVWAELFWREPVLQSKSNRPNFFNKGPNSTYSGLCEPPMVSVPYSLFSKQF